MTNPNPALEALKAQLEALEQEIRDGLRADGGCGHTLKECQEVWCSGGSCCVVCSHR